MATFEELMKRAEEAGKTTEEDKVDFLEKPGSGVSTPKPIELKQKPAPPLTKRDAVNTLKQPQRVTNELPERFQPKSFSGKTLGDVFPEETDTMNQIFNDVVEVPTKVILGSAYDLSHNLGNLTRINHLGRTIDQELNNAGIGSDYDLHVNGVTTEWDETKDFMFFSEADPNSIRNKILAGRWFKDEPDNPVNRVTRPIISFVTALAITKRIIPATPSRPITSDIVAGLAAFPLEDKRALEYLTEVMEGTPVESDIGRAVNNLIRADEDTPELIQALQVAVDAVFIDGALRGFGKIASVTYKGIAKIGRDKRLRKREIAEKLAEHTANATVADVQKLVGPMSPNQKREVAKALRELQTKVKRKKTKKATKKGGTATPKEGELILPSMQVLNKALAFDETDLLGALEAVISGSTKTGAKIDDSFRVFNLDTVRELGMHQTVEMVAAIYRKKRLFSKHATKGGMTPKRKFLSTEFFKPKNQKLMQDEAAKIAGDIKGAEHPHELQYAATLHGESVETLRKRMASKYDDIAGMESELFAYRIILRDLGIDFSRKINTPGSIENPITRLELLNDFQQLSDLFTLHSHIGATIGRSLAQFGVKVPPAFTRKGKLIPRSELTEAEATARDVFINQQLNKNGFNKDMAEMIRFAFVDTSLPIHKRIKLALEGSEAFGKKAIGGVLEAFRSQLLSSFKVFEQAAFSGTIETAFAPLSDLLGSTIRAGVKAPFTSTYKDDLVVANKAVHRLMGIYKHFIPATLKGLKAFKEGKNTLDPLRTVIDDSGLKTGHYIGLESSSKWLNWLVNSTGAAIRMPLRGLGAMDETLKQINYASWAYGEIMTSMPKNIKRAKPYTDEAGKLVNPKLDYIENNMPKYYDEYGRGTNEAGIQYARERIFQETLEAGKLITGMDRVIRKSRFLEFWLPIRRTPANVVKRLINRHEGFIPLRAEIRRQWLEGTPDEKAKILGDTILAGGMITTVWNYLGEDRITGAGPRDLNRREAWEKTHEPYSIRIGDEWYPYDRYAPVTGAIMIMSDIYENAWEYNGHKERVMELAMLGFMQSLGNMHFVGNFYDVFEAMQDAYQDPDKLKSLITKPFEKAGVVPKYIEQGSHYFTGTPGFKETKYYLEKVQASAAGALKTVDPSFWHDLEAEEYDWLTGGLIQRVGDGTFGKFQEISGILPKTITKTKYDLVWTELEKMGAHLSAPQRSWKKWNGKTVGIELTPEMFSEYKRLMGTLLVDNPVDPSKPKATLIETLHDVIASPSYKWDSTASYPPIEEGVHVGDPDRRIGLLQDIMTAFREAAKLRLPFVTKIDKETKKEVRKFPGLYDLLLHRMHVIATNNVSRDLVREDPKTIPPIKQYGIKGGFFTELLGDRITDTFRLSDKQIREYEQKYSIGN